MRCLILLRAALMALMALGSGFTLLEAARPLPEDADRVELFQAMADGHVDVQLIPRDAEQVTLIVANKLDKPLAIKLPEAFAAMPVLGQNFLPPFQQNGNANRLQSPQVLGVPGPNPLGPNQRQNDPFNNFRFFEGLMNVPPEKTVRVKIATVCLEYGKPTPRAKMAYEIKPLDSFTDDTEVRELLRLFATGRFRQPAAQLAVWHLTSGFSWEDLERMEIKRPNGQRAKQFDSRTIDAAKQMVDQLPTRRPKVLSGEDTLTRR